MTTTMADLKGLCAAYDVPSRTQTFDDVTVLYTNVAGARIWADHSTPGDPITHAGLDQFIAAEREAGRTHTDDALTFPLFGIDHTTAGGHSDHS